MIFNMSESIEASGGGNDFIVTLSYDSQSDMWTPDKTLAEIVAAYSAEKDIATYAYNSVDDMIQASGGYYEEGSDEFWYWVDNSDSDSSGDYIISSTYYLDSNGVTLDETTKSYRTATADAIPADVANGKIFYNANGQQIGTASSGEVLWANWNSDIATYNSSGTPQVTDLSITIPTAGTYKVKSIIRNTYPYSYGSGVHVRFYKNNTAVGTQHAAAAATFSVVEETISCAAGDVIKLYANSANSTYTTACSGIFVCPAS